MATPRQRVALVALFVLLQAVLALGKDYYEILSVPRGANDAQIKRSYRKLALKYHPDKVTGSDDEKEAASKKFADINHAYEVLSDPEKRQVYDRHGEAGLKQHQAQQGGGGGQQDIFSFFFGGQRGQQEEQTPKGHDVLVDLQVTLKDLYLGREFKVTRDKSVVKPAPGTRQCRCKMKVETRQLGPGMFQQYHTQACEQCDNVKLEREQEEITVHVDPGMHDGHQISFFEEGEPLIDGETGDLKFVVRTLPSDRWERRTNDLMINETITLVDALVGFSKQIDHLDGHKVTIGSQGVTKPGDFQHIESEGMPIHDTNKRGALWVKYTVAFPPQLTDEQKKVIKELFGG